MPEHKSYPSIGQFRNVIKSVHDTTRYAGRDENDDPIFDGTKPLPTLNFLGTVKLHGTNAAFGFCRSGNEIWFQSRENIVVPGKDNAGFAAKYHGQDLSSLFGNLPGDTVIIFGEWCGQGIQKTVAIANIPKMFVIFDILIDGVWQSREVVSKVKDESLRVFNIHDFNSTEIEIDFNSPELVQNRLVELTTLVADRCPVALSFGSEGIGEGIVWSCTTPNWEGTKFKVKDERHAQGAGKVKVLAEIDPQAVAGAKEFAALVVTDSRCWQGIEKMKERGISLERSCLGHYLQWIFEDVIKEETDVAVKSNVDLTKAKSHISTLARNWFFAHEGEF